MTDMNLNRNGESLKAKDDHLAWTRTISIGLIIIIVTLGAMFLFGRFYWFKQNEHVAVWLEGFALILIFGLDYFNRLDEARERKSEHEETIQQLDLLRKQSEAAKTQADSSSESLQMLKAQTMAEQLRELWRVLPILDDLQGQVRHWLSILEDNKWNSVNQATRIMPAEPSAVLVQAARHSNELWTEVRETFRMISNADYQLDRFYSITQPSYRQDNFATDARDSLRNAEPKLTRIAGKFKIFEEAERKASQRET